MWRLVDTLSQRTFQLNIAAAQAQEFAINRALSAAFGRGDQLPKWPDWEDAGEIEDRLNPAMQRLRGQALPVDTE